MALRYVGDDALRLGACRFLSDNLVVWTGNQRDGLPRGPGSRSRSWCARGARTVSHAVKLSHKNDAG